MNLLNTNIRGRHTTDRHRKTSNGTKSGIRYNTISMTFVIIFCLVKLIFCNSDTIFSKKFKGE